MRAEYWLAILFFGAIVGIAATILLAAWLCGRSCARSMIRR